MQRPLDFSQALDQLTVIAQPICHLRSGVMVGFELLSRVTGSSLEAFFTQLQASEAGLPVLRSLRTRFAEVASLLPPHVRTFINLTALELRQDLLLATRPVLPGLEHHKLVVELPETMPVEAVHEAATSLACLRARGVELAVDDSNLTPRDTAVKRMILSDWVKLDRALIRRAPTSLRAQALVEGAVVQARLEGIRLIAEGIERLEELEALTCLGLEYGQGFLLGRPAPLEMHLTRRGARLDAVESFDSPEQARALEQRHQRIRLQQKLNRAHYLLEPELGEERAERGPPIPRGPTLALGLVTAGKTEGDA